MIMSLRLRDGKTHWHDIEERWIALRDFLRREIFADIELQFIGADTKRAPAQKRRIGAAVAMCAAGGPEGRERIRRVAEHLETRKLRIAVERAAEGILDEETLAAAEAEDAVIGRGSL